MCFWESENGENISFLPQVFQEIAIEEKGQSKGHKEGLNNVAAPQNM